MPNNVNTSFRLKRAFANYEFLIIISLMSNFDVIFRKILDVMTF